MVHDVKILAVKVPQIGHLKPFGCLVTILNTSDHLGKFEGKADEGPCLKPMVPSVMERNADMQKSSKLQDKIRNPKSSMKLKIQTRCLLADRDSAGIGSAGGVSAGSTSAGSHPAGTFQPAGSYDPAALGDPAASTSVSADFIPVHADESTLPPGQVLGSSENTTRFPVPSDVCKDQISSGIFTSSSYDDDFRATLTNLAPAVEVNPVPTKRVNTIHPQSQILGDLASPVLTRSRAQKSKFGESAFHWDYIQTLEDPDWVDTMQEEIKSFINQQVWKLCPYYLDIKSVPADSFKYIPADNVLLTFQVAFLLIIFC
ncbi:hypothetical protein Tco_0965639 [Tanacetum coccineum]